MVEHTQTPWEWVDTNEGVHVKSTVKPGYFVDVRRTRAEQDPETDARRIVAAVNACEGIPTDALEDGVVDDLLEAAYAVDVVYAELSAALPKLAEESPDGWRIVMDAVSTARNAIAKAEGAE